MVVAVLVGDSSVLDLNNTREMVTRIPEVGIRIRQAQNIIDQFSKAPVDLFSCLLLDDASFAKLGTVRSIIVSTVQLGLYDRYIRKNGNPQIVVGLKGALTLLNIFAGTSDLSDLIRPLVATEFVAPDMAQVLTLVSNQGAYDILKLGVNGAQIVASESANPEQLVTKLVDDYNVSRIVNVGPGSTSITSQSVDPVYERLQICESIDIDQMLNWAVKIA